MSILYAIIEKHPIFWFKFSQQTFGNIKESIYLKTQK